MPRRTMLGAASTTSTTMPSPMTMRSPGRRVILSTGGSSLDAVVTCGTGGLRARRQRRLDRGPRGVVEDVIPACARDQHGRACSRRTRPRRRAHREDGRAATARRRRGRGARRTHCSTRGRAGLPDRAEQRLVVAQRAGEVAAQLAVQLADAALGHAEEVAYLAQRELLDVEQDGDLALPARKLVKGLTEARLGVGDVSGVRGVDGEEVAA